MSTPDSREDYPLTHWKSELCHSASKSGLDAMIRAIALEVGPHGIRINNVNPGIINTPMAQNNGGE